MQSDEFAQDSIEYRARVAEAQVAAMESWAVQLESESPQGVGPFIAREIRDRLRQAAFSA